MNKNLSPEKEKNQSLDGSDQVAVRKDKLDKMRESGIDPFRANWDQTHVSKEAVALLPEEEETGPEVSVAGRIVAFRLMGKASFIKILDRAGKIQSYVRKDEIGEDDKPIQIQTVDASHPPISKSMQKVFLGVVSAVASANSAVLLKLDI